MRETVLLIALLAAAYCGFAALALSQPRHRMRAIGDAAPSLRQVRQLRVIGSALLVVGFVVAIVRDGASFGIIVWATTISVAAIAVAFTLTWRPLWVGMIVPFKRPGAVQRR